jgi:hypothetical protein
MIDFIGTVAVTTAVIAVISLLTGALPVRQGSRVALLLLAGVWIGTVAALAAAGEFNDVGRRPFPLVGVAFATPLLLVAAAAISSPTVRSALLGLPTSLLVALNSARIFGFLFLVLAAAGRLGGPFPYSAGWGDIIAGAFAIPVAVLAARSVADHARSILAWNVFGALDLVVAVGLGVTSTVGSPLQLFGGEIGSSAMPFLPWIIIPTVLVPIFLIVHAVIFAQLRLQVGVRATGARAGQFG